MCYIKLNRRLDELLEQLSSLMFEKLFHPDRFDEASENKLQELKDEYLRLEKHLTEC